MHKEEKADGIIAFDENVVLALTPMNIGNGPTADIVGYAGKKDDVSCLGEGRFQQSSIAPDSSGEAFLIPMRVKSQVQGRKTSDI